MTVRDLIETLENLPYDLPVVIDDHEAVDVVLREEIYLSEEYGYKDHMIVKII